MHRLFAFAVAAGLLAAAAPAFAPPALAHAHLERATPPVGATVKSAPAELSLTFSEAVEPALCRVTVHDAAGHAMQTGAPHAGADAKQLVVGLTPLAAGSYSVEWHAVSVDTHKTEGRFRFTVAP